MTFAILRWVARLLGEILISSALDAASKKVLTHAVRIAEDSGKSGQEKMAIALKHIHIGGTESLKRATVSRLRTLIEQQIDRLGL